MNTESSLTVRDTSAERDNRWFSTTSEHVEYRSDSISRNQNVIRLPVTSTLVKQSSAYIPLPQTTTTTTYSRPLSSTISAPNLQLGVGQSINITSSNSHIPASYVVGPATVINTAPKELQGSFGALPPPPVPLPISTIKHEQVTTTSIYRPGSSTPHINSNYNIYSTDPLPSKIDHEKCITECRNWEIKYNDLYSRYLGISNERSRSPNPSESSEVQRLREENRRLEQRVISLEENEKRIAQNVEVYLGNIINNIRESTTRETGLLFDRFRLECRAIDKS